MTTPPKHDSGSQLDPGALEPQSAAARLSGDLDWLAFRYSTGELSEAEALEFESRLASDQPVREALARIVGLAETVRALESGALLSESSQDVMPAAAAHRNWSERNPMRTGGWVAAAVAACVAIVMTWQAFRTDRAEMARRRAPEQRAAEQNITGQPANTAAKPEPIDDETRLLLALLAEEQVGESAAVVTAFARDDMGDSEFDVVRGEGTTDDHAFEDQNVTPDWLLAAVAESQS